jgi:sugar/nucleoside kinase (ribokinase family)
MNPNGFVSLQVHESEMASKSIKELTKIMKLIDMIFLNEFEFNKIEEKVSNLKGYLFLTRGNKGVEVFFHNKKIGSICSPNVEVVDVTGAGDAFAGGVLATYLRFKNKTDGEDLLNLMLKEGTLLAGYTLSDYGFDNIFKLLKIKKKL